MIPKLPSLTTSINEVTYATKTYHLNGDEKRVDGYSDGTDAVAQAIYLILNTERYRYPIYDWNYGVELLDLYGKPLPYVVSEAERRITEALMQDDRIKSVDNFQFAKTGRKLHVTFDVTTDTAKLQVEKEVDV